MSVFSSAFKSLYMHMCLCGVMKERPGTLHNKEAGSTHSLQQCERERKERQRRDETEQYASPSPLSKLALTSGRKAFHRWAAWSKREFVQSNFILTFLAFFSSKYNPPLLQQPGKLIHRSMRSTGLYALAIWAQWTKRRKATDQMVTKGTNEIEATHTRMLG